MASTRDDLPKVLHFCGHRTTADAETAGGFAPSAVGVVAARVGEYLDGRTIEAAYGALACGADIIIAEALLARGVPLHVVLPFGIEEFEEISVRSGGEEWIGRYRSCLEQAASTLIAYDSAYADDPVLFGYAAKVAMGHALNRAQRLGIDAEQLAVWDGQPGGPDAGTGHDVAAWRAAGRTTHVVPVQHRRAARERQAQFDPASPRHIGAMVFADARGSSQLSDQHQQTYVERVLQPFGDVLDTFIDKVEYCNTWGEALVVVCADIATAAAVALTFQQLTASLDLELLDLPKDFGLCVSAHVGPLISLDDPVRRVPAFWGRELARAVRVEPGAPEGEVYVTDAFVALCTLECGDDFVCDYVETGPMYRLRPA